MKRLAELYLPTGQGWHLGQMKQQRFLTQSSCPSPHFPLHCSEAPQPTPHSGLRSRPCVHVVVPTFPQVMGRQAWLPVQNCQAAEDRGMRGQQGHPKDGEAPPHILPSLGSASESTVWPGKQEAMKSMQQRSSHGPAEQEAGRCSTAQARQASPQLPRQRVKGHPVKGPATPQLAACARACTV